EQITRSCRLVLLRPHRSLRCGDRIMLLDSRESRKRIASFQGLRHGNLAISSQQSRQKTTLAQWVRNSSRATSASPGPAFPMRRVGTLTECASRRFPSTNFLCRVVVSLINGVKALEAKYERPAAVAWEELCAGLPHQ